MHYKNLLLQKQLVVFSHWTRKSYAVFNSLSRTIKIGMLVTPIGMLVQATDVSAQKDSSATSMTVLLEEAEVEADQAALVYSQQSRIVTVIQHEEIQQCPAANLSDVIEYAAGIDLRNRGSEVQSDLSFRGATFEQTLVLLDGINVSDPQSGHYSLNIPVDLHSISRIEILHGSGARLYGSSAYSATINIITADPDSTRAAIAARAGQHNTYEGSTRISLKNRNLGQTLSLEAKKSAGYRSNTDYNLYQSLYRANFETSIIKFRVLAGYQKKSFGANSFYSAKYPEQYDINSGFFGNLKIEKNSGLPQSLDLYYRRHRDHFMLFREHPEYYQNFHRTDVSGIRYKMQLSHKHGKTSLGAEIRNEQILSSNLGLPADSVPVWGQDSAWYQRAAGRSVCSVFADYSVWFAALHLSAGGLYHYLPESNTHGFYPGIDLSYSRKNGSVYLSASRNLRLPSFTELYYKAPDMAGNAGLQAEEALSLESGYKYRQQGIEGSIAIFYRDGRNLIDWVWEDAVGLWRTENINRVQTGGAELSIGWRAEKHGAGQGDAHFQWNTLVSGLRFNYVFTQNYLATSSYQTRYTGDYLRHNGSLQANFRINQHIGCSLHASFQSRMGEYQQYNPADNTYSSAGYQPFFRQDIRVWYQSSSWKIYIDILNISNIQYIDIGNIPQPGRWISIGFQWNVI